MIYQPPLVTNKVSITEELKRLKGELDDKTAKISLAKFLFANLGFCCELVSGVRPFPYQEILLRAWFNSNFSLNILSRGAGKTTIAGYFCFLYPLFFPGSKLVIAGPVFRSTRAVFLEVERIVNSKNGEFLQQCFSQGPTKRNDICQWAINGGSLTAIPLGGEKVRGLRANVLILDEMLLIPDELIKNVLMPFLVVPQNIKEKMDIRSAEDDLIKAGHMKEDERMVFPNNSKLIGLSSASYTFEPLYKTYCDWSEKSVLKEVKETKYVVAQMGWESIPPDLIDLGIIEEAKTNSSTSSFQREYESIFSSNSDSYFNALKMHQATIPDGTEPNTKLTGCKNKNYILSIDPSFAENDTSDFFAMSVLELGEKNDSTLVHNYGVAGGQIKDHIKYLFYLYTHFNIVMIIIDNAGFQFLDSASESELFSREKIVFDFIDELDFSKEGEEYTKMLVDAKRHYNKTAHKICIKQHFSSHLIRKANESLQAAIDNKRIWFASRTAADEEFFKKESDSNIPLELTGIDIKTETIGTLIEIQDDWIYKVKTQCALIEVKSTANGTQTFDIPAHLKKSKSVNKARKDNYTTLFLGNCAAQIYRDLFSEKSNSAPATFTPFFV